jgi:hypothetical protein
VVKIGIFLDARRLRNTNPSTNEKITIKTPNNKKPGTSNRNSSIRTLKRAV